MQDARAAHWRRIVILLNYLFLAAMNVLFYMGAADAGPGHAVDIVGIALFGAVIFTAVRLYGKTGLWRLTHAKCEALDERELQQTHWALRHSYAWFTVVCLVLMLAHSIFYRLVPGIDFPLSIPLVASMIYLAHTLPGAVLGWSLRELPGEAEVS